MQEDIQKLEMELGTASVIEGWEQRPTGRHRYDQVRFQQQVGHGRIPRRGPVKVLIGHAEYERVITKVPTKQKKGCSIFYASNSSDHPYLILMYDEYLVAEYRLVSLADANLPSEMLLRLSQAVLKAHSDGIVLGPSLGLGNLDWDVSYDCTGLPYVTFKNLPLPVASIDRPPPPPKWPVPELISDSSGSTSTKETDIYVTPIVLFQLIHEVEQTALAPKKQVSFVNGRPEIPAVVQKNKPLLRIVQKCLSPNPAKRPTAAGLCDSLLRLCKLSIVRSVVCDAGKSFLSALGRLTL